MTDIEVIATSNPRHLRHLLERRGLLDAMHICATASLTGQLQKVIPSGPAETVSSIGRMLRKLLPEWFTAAATLRQLTDLRRYAGQPSETETDGGLEGLRRNLTSVLQALRLLAEFDIGAEELTREAGTDPDQQRRRKLLLDCLHHLERQGGENGFAQMRSLHRGEFPSEERLAQVIAPPGSTLVLHGFYFVSGPQLALLARLRDLGYRLVFIVFSSRHPSETGGFRVWERFFGVHGRGLLPHPETWQWDDETPLPAAARALLGALEGGQRVNLPDGLKVVGYADVSRLLEACHQGPPGIIHAPDDETLGQSIAAFDPAAPPELRHIFRYPVGRLLLYLHSVCSPFSEQPELTPDQVAECLASGLLRTADRNGRSLLAAFGRLQPYVRDCRTADQWRQRMRDLLTVLQTMDSDRLNSAWSVLRRQLAGQSPAVLEIRRNHPLRYLSQFSLPIRDAEALSDLVEQLFRMAEQLFGRQERSLSEHVEQLKALLSIDSTDEELREEEQELCRKLVASLTDDTGALGDIRFLPWELIDAVRLFLADTVTGEDGPAGDEACPGQGTIRRFEDLDAVPFCPVTDGLLRLTLLNEKFLPAAERALPWPLDHRWLEACPADGAALLRDFRLCLGESQLFLLVSALSSGRSVELSWIRYWQDDEQGPSPYLQLLAEETAESSGDLGEIEAWILEADPECREVDYRTIDAWVMQLRDAELAEAAVCVRRFHYSVVCGPEVHFGSPFHQNFLLGNYLALLCHGEGDRSQYRTLLSDTSARMAFRAWSELEFLRAVETGRNVSGKAHPHDFTLPRSLWQFQLLARNRRKRSIPALQQARTLITGDRDENGKLVDIAEAEYLRLQSDLRNRVTAWLQGNASRPIPRTDDANVCVFCPWRDICPDRTADEDTGGLFRGKADGAEILPGGDSAPSTLPENDVEETEYLLPAEAEVRLQDSFELLQPLDEAVDFPDPIGDCLNPDDLFPGVDLLPELQNIVGEPALEMHLDRVVHDYWLLRDWLDYLAYRADHGPENG